VGLLPKEWNLWKEWSFYPKSGVLQIKWVFAGRVNFVEGVECLPEEWSFADKVEFYRKKESRKYE